MKLLKHINFDDVQRDDKVYCAIHGDGYIYAYSRFRKRGYDKITDRVCIRFEDEFTIDDVDRNILDVFYVGPKGSARDTSWVPLSNVIWNNISIGDIVSSARGILGVIKDKKQFHPADPERMYIYIEWSDIHTPDSVVAHNSAQCILTKQSK